ncbi:periplasmic binding protein-like II [Anaeromyces robustus]|uniref:Periplasmic binding protein-like II n=1 Tax=Anaeromyces robustus TaxID=1754192 RepID=A0A1Y1X378_9FUNG|nr:periplasmic binding protein-like II [Anaeromyces robustus]|eukprot:ORX80088.1 periplasmic binding protein-like II [Anaeromyces robustus]
MGWTYFAVLYSNNVYLDKYNKKPPKTWDELIKISKEIITEERKNNTSIITFNGLLNDVESGTCTINEIIYSFRESVDAPYPKLPSKESIAALEMMKKMKDEIGSETLFRSSDDYTFTRLITGDYIFLKFWFFPDIPDLYITPLPGGKEGISGSSIGGFNLGINKYIPDDKKDAALKALQYITSKEVQKKVALEKHLYTAIPSLYDDEEVCEVVDCAFFKSIQLTPRPITPDYSEYSDKYRNYVYEFLYGDESAEKVLKDIRDMTKIYSLSLSTEDSTVGLFITVTVISISFIMILSLSLLFIEKVKIFFNFLENDLWFISIIGIILVTSVCYLDIGKITVAKCESRILLLSLGFTLNIIPFLYKLLINYPEQNKISQWVRQNKYYFILAFILIDLILFEFTFITPYKVRNIIIKDGKNFEVCNMEKGFGNFLNMFMISEKFIIMLALLFLIFIEWSIEVTYYDVRFLVFAIYCCGLSVIAMLIVSHIEINDYIKYYTIRDSIYIFYGLTSYILLYGYRIFYIIIKKDNEDDLYLKRFRDNMKNTTNQNQINSSSKYSVSSNSNHGSSSIINIADKLINLHYQKSSSNPDISIRPPTSTSPDISSTNYTNPPSEFSSNYQTQSLY